MILDLYKMLGPQEGEPVWLPQAEPSWASWAKALCLVVGPGWAPSNDLCKVIWTTDLLSWSWSDTKDQFVLEDTIWGKFLLDKVRCFGQARLGANPGHYIFWLIWERLSIHPQKSWRR